MRLFSQIWHQLKGSPTNHRGSAGLAQTPEHVAIIMDGNGRWANRRGLPRVAGHRAGADTLKEIVRVADEVGVRYLTVYAFSTENWRRPDSEVTYLFNLLSEVLNRDIEELNEQNVQLRVIGRRKGLPEKVISELDRATSLTSDNDGLVLNIAFNYGGRAELVDAVRALARKVENGELTPEAIDEAALAAHLYTADVPDPDLIIRTGGDFRLSNFLLWQAAYAEVFVTPVCWPDFDRDIFLHALREFAKRERRFGGLPGTAGNR